MTAPKRRRRASTAASPGWRPSLRSFPGPHPGLRRSVGLTAGLVAMLLSGDAVAGSIGVGRCTLTVPAGWHHLTRSSARSPDGAVTIQVREVMNGQVFINFQRAFGMRLFPTLNPASTILFARVGNMTRYHVVTPPTAQRACTAQVTSRTAAGSEEARNIALGVRRLPDQQRVQAQQSQIR